MQTKKTKRSESSKILTFLKGGKQKDGWNSEPAEKIS